MAGNNIGLDDKRTLYMWCARLQSGMDSVYTARKPVGLDKFAQIIELVRLADMLKESGALMTVMNKALDIVLAADLRAVAQAQLACVHQLGKGEISPARLTLDTSGHGVVPGDWDMAKPLVIQVSAAFGAFSSNANVVQVMTNYGSRYKKANGFDEEQKTSQVLMAKQGKEEAERFYSEVIKAKKDFIIDISACSRTWMTTSWLFGHAPSQCGAGLSANSAALLRVLMFGSMEVYTAPVADLVAALKSIGKPTPKVSDLEATILTLCPKDFDELIKLVNFFYATLTKEQILYVRPHGPLGNR